MEKPVHDVGLGGDLYIVVLFRREGRPKQPFVPDEHIEFGVTVEAPVTEGTKEAAAQVDDGA